MAKCFVCQHVLIAWEKTPRFADIQAAVEWVGSPRETFEDWDLRIHRWKRGLRTRGGTFEWMVLLALKLQSYEFGRCVNCEHALTEMDEHHLLSDPIARSVLQDRLSMNSAVTNQRKQPHLATLPKKERAMTTTAVKPKYRISPEKYKAWKEHQAKIQAEVEQHLAFVRSVCDLLGEPTTGEQFYRIHLIIRVLGRDRVVELLHRTLEVEQQGGLLIKDSSRRRSTGGVFYQLAKEQHRDLLPARVFRPPVRPVQEVL